MASKARESGRSGGRQSRNPYIEGARRAIERKAINPNERTHIDQREQTARRPSIPVVKMDVLR